VSIIRRAPGFVLTSLACVVIVVGAYWNSFSNSFHFDDRHVIEDNLYIRSLSNVPRFFSDATTFSSIRSHASYRPLLSLTLALDYAEGALDPRPYHRTQLLLLVVLGAMLAVFFEAVLRKAGVEHAAWAALAAATLFSVHTANTETLNFISARSEELAVIGVVGAFLVWLKLPRWRRTELHQLPMLFGALAKVHAVMYGSLLFAGVWLWQPETESVPRRTRRALAETWPALVGSVLVYLFIRRMDAPEWTGGGGARLPYAWTQPLAWLRYARLFVVPTGLTADSDWSMLPHWYDARAIAGYIFLVVLALAFARTWRRRTTAPIAFGVAWFALALVPTSSVFPFSEIVNEHRVFFPFVGLALAAACAVQLSLLRLIPVSGARARVAAALAVAVVGVHAASTHVRNRAWRDEKTLWLDVTRKSPANSRGLMNYGLQLVAGGEASAARDYFERAARLSPGYSTLEINLGIAYGALHQPAIAEPHFLRAIALADDADSRFYYARWLTEVARSPEALPHLRRSIAISPGAVEPRHLLMRLLAAAGDEAALRQAAAEMLALDPADRDARAYAAGASPLAGPPAAAMADGLAAIQAGRFVDGAEIFRGLILANPRSADAWNDRGWSQHQLGFARASIASFIRALQIDPGLQRARNNLALAATEQ
jgi:tetratricopeptide (TPR) repeat protein